MSIVKTSSWPLLAKTDLDEMLQWDNFFDRKWEINLPAVNISETDKNYEIEVAVPGFDKKDFKVAVHDNVLKISAEKKAEKSEKDKKYTRKEFTYSSFERSFNLPSNVNTEKIDAKYTDGLLKLTVAKLTETVSKKSKEISIK